MTRPEAAAAIDRSRLPAHVAIIMDGNGRWAQDRGLARLEGHRQGAQVVREITTHARRMGVRFLTLYSFSRQNWRRPPIEVAGLMSLLENYCHDERRTLMDNDIRLTTIGQTRRLPKHTRKALEELAEHTRHNKSMTLCLALDYGGREEIVSACRHVADDVMSGRLSKGSIDERAIAARLGTAAMPDPDLLIRTSGELRVSNFLLWQLAYAEMHFTQVRWPDFQRDDFDEAMRDFARRQRRFGLTESDPSSAPAGAHAWPTQRARTHRDEDPKHC